MLYQLKQRYWQWVKQRQLLNWSRSLPAAAPATGNHGLTAFVAEEFYHPDLRGYGGFGHVIKTIAEHSLAQPNATERIAMAFSTATPLVEEAELRYYHGTPVALRPAAGDYLGNLAQYRDLLLDLAPRALLCIDWYPSYLPTVLAMPNTPVLIWIRDPRDAIEWRRIQAVPGELGFRGLKQGSQLGKFANEKRDAFKVLLNQSRRVGRKLVFCTKAEWLIERAQATYGIEGLQAHLLPTPIKLPALENTIAGPLSERPSLLFLGRLDPVKRPWIAFEIAARHPELDVWIAGHIHQQHVMAPWLERYAGLPNLKLLGQVDGAEKDRLLSECWALLNTSVHEAEPISFLEAFSFGKPVITSHAREDCVVRFGYYAGPVEGEGLDEASLAAYDRAIAQMLSNPDVRFQKGLGGREMVRTRHSFESFYSALHGIFRQEGIAL